MNKKIFLVAIFLIIATIYLAAVSYNLNVNTPNGFEINDNLTVKEEKVQFLGMDAVRTVVVMENGTDHITITTFQAEHDMDMSASGNSQAKTIHGKEGIYQKNDDRFVFIYKDQGQFVQIDSPSEKLIEEVLS